MRTRTASRYSRSLERDARSSASARVTWHSRNTRLAVIAHFRFKLNSHLDEVIYMTSHTTFPIRRVDRRHLALASVVLRRHALEVEWDSDAWPSTCRQASEGHVSESHQAIRGESPPRE